jgi:hypothetical protein
MTAGKLASAKPAVTTNTLLYRCPITKAASAVLNVVNQDAAGQTYRVALRDYDQILTLDGDYSFRKGNVISSYQMEINPGVEFDSLTPGDLITIDNNNATFRYLDIFKPTATITVPVKVETIGSLNFDSSEAPFVDGDVIVGDNSGLEATVYRYTSLSARVHIDGISDTDVTFIVSNPTVVAANDYLYIPDTTPELVSVDSITGYEVTVTREEIGSTATAHVAGLPMRVVRPTATTTTISADIIDDVGDTINLTSATGFALGGLILIGNELMSINNVAGNVVTVVRGQLGTTAVPHTSGAAALYLTDEGFTTLNYFESGEPVTGEGISAVVSEYVASAFTHGPQPVFVYDFGGDTIYSYPVSLSLDADRTYRFTQSDASNTGSQLLFSTTEDGPTDYTIGVTNAGTPGTGGAYTQIAVTNSTSTLLFTKSDGAIGYGLPSPPNLTPLYNVIYIYDVEGEIVATDSFDTSTGSNTVIATEAGPYGYVMDIQGNDLKVSLGLNSQAFDIAGTDTFYDTPRTTNAVRSLVTLTSATALTAVNSEDYLAYGATVSTAAVSKISSVVVGPGQSLVVYSSDADMNYLLNGFEDSTNDFPIIHYSRVTSA